MSDEIEKKVLKYLTCHPNARLPELCIGLNLHVYVVDAALKNLIDKGSVKGRGYASHTEEYYVVDKEEA